ncbi:hypothetical protein Hanom_Chr00s001712g01686961 [Helianthus anomalus]
MEHMMLMPQQHARGTLHEKRYSGYQSTKGLIYITYKTYFHNKTGHILEHAIMSITT